EQVGLGSQLKDNIPVTEFSVNGPSSKKGFSLKKTFQFNQDKMNFSTPRNIWGLFAPLKLHMEFKAMQQVLHLPFLPSSNLSAIGFENIFNDISQRELMGKLPLMMEYKLDFL
ncbi:hypothetical protein K5549_021404, partial [Capra hircus]